jgi:hypothetical protein
MNRTLLRGILVDESFAYGFTIAFWGSGLLLIERFGVLASPGVIAYATGAITGFALLAVTTFGGAIDTLELESSPSYHVLAAVHYLAALVPIGLTHFLIEVPIGARVTIFSAGLCVSVCYNLTAALEETVSKRVERIE